MYVFVSISSRVKCCASMEYKAAYRPQLLRNVMIDGLPGFVSIDRGEVLQTTALEVRGGKITALYIVRNPDKLRHVEAMLAERTA